MGVWSPGPGPTSGDDTFTGDNTNEIASGGDGADTLNGGGGNDTLEGGGGDDNIDGGAGVDTVTYANASAGIAVSLATNAVQNTSGAGLDWIINAENLTGSAFNDTLTGNSSANIISGGAGSDTITGGAGADSLSGGDGDDAFIYAAGAGTDTVTDFDADASGGQDLINISAFGINVVDFATRVTITDLGADTLITIDGSVTITLLGVTGDGDNTISQADFILAP